MISFACPGCGRRLKVKDQAAGRKSQCPGCGKSIQVPSATVTEANSPATEPAAVAAQFAASPSATLPDAVTQLPEVPTRTEQHIPVAAPAPLPGVPAGILAPPTAPGEIGRLGPYRVLKV